jgi:hypothetical protein
MMASPDEIRAFATQYLPMAQAQAARIGTTPENVLAQWAQETGYGKSVIPGTNNLGNVKQVGPGGVAARDNALGTTDRYAAYDSPQAGAQAFGNVVTGDRYAGARGITDPVAYGNALHAGGYAQDPNYGQHIGGVVNTLKKYASDVFGMATGSGSAQAGELTPDQQAAYRRYQNAQGGPAFPAKPAPAQPAAQAAQKPQKDAADDIFAPSRAGIPMAGVVAQMPASPSATPASMQAPAQAPAQDPNALDPNIFKPSTAYQPPKGAAAPTAAPQGPAGMPAPAAGPQPASGAPNVPVDDKGVPIRDRGFSWDNLGRQLGLTGRAGVTGTTSLPLMISDTLFRPVVNLGVKGINALGGNLPEAQPLADKLQEGLDAAGFAKPETTQEKIAQAGAAGVASAAGGGLLGKLLSAGQQVPGAAKTFTDMLQAQIGTQATAGAGGAMGSQAAHEAGLGPWGELAAGIGGTLAGVGAGSAAGRVANYVNTARAAEGPNLIQKLTGTDTATQQANAVQRANAGEVAARQATSNTGLGTSSQRGIAPEVTPENSQRLNTQATQNPNVDPAQLQRRQDFRDLGIDPTTGQISRDPTQYAQEQNLRATNGGRLANRFNQQDQQLAGAIEDLSPGIPQEAYSAGRSTKDVLTNIDNQMSGQVRDAYTAARNSTGAQMDVPTQGLAQDYARILDTYGDQIPTSVRNQFERLGLMSGNQQRIFNMEDADQIGKIINKNVGNDRTVNSALGELRTALNTAVQAADDQGGAFAPAKALARQRFQLHEAIPALKDAVDDKTAADTFIRTHVINAPTEDAQNLANLLREHAPDQFAQLKSQMVQSLQDAAYGGGEQFKPAAFAKQMTRYGTEKLSAFFDPDEIAQLKTIGRVGSYMRTTPSASPVNFSNSATSLMGMLSNAPGVSHIPYVGRLLEAASNRAFQQQALAGGFQNVAVPAALSGPAGGTSLMGLLSGRAAGAANR